ncbi:MAG TPA: hypothetical protein VMH35_04305 [Streptosporangiaceae bacterium]|nr:hypothetical protein [Streptosporangiaceae bacterium]
MADQVGTDIQSGAQPDDGALPSTQGERDNVTAAGPRPGYYEPFHGRPVSWVAVGLIMVGFLIGGLALVFHTIWWLFWGSLALVVIGGLIALSTNIFEDWY